MAIDLNQLSQDLTPIDPTSRVTGSGQSYLPGTFTILISLLLYLAGIVTIIAIMYGGILYITAAGDPTKAAKGRLVIINGLIGAVMVILSLAILRAVVRILGA